jgi:peptidoglycan L-alanyl-D-glutamate endopeptidase CwlK
MGLDPRGLLGQVHPDLVKVVNAAAQTPQPFQIVYGLRTLAAEQAAVASGHSQTLHSRHLADARYGGLAMAIDFACLTDGAIDWTVADAAGGIYGHAAAQILDAAESVGVKVQWGGQAVGAWIDGQPSHFRDWGHVQLDPSAYP